MRLRNPEVRIENTSRCNTHCTICPRDKMTRPKMTMGFRHFTKLVDQVIDMGCDTISIFGYGEPLLDPGIVQKVRYCTIHGLKTFITTNGALLDYNMSHDLLKSGLSRLRVSAHGRMKNYEKVHKLNWENFRTNVLEFSKMNKTVFNNVCKIDVSVIPMHGELVQDIVQYWQLHMDGIEVWKPHNWGNAKEYREQVTRKKTCGRPSNGPLQINADGKMMVCCFDFDAQLTVGDTHANTIETILKGEEFNKIREAHKTGNHCGLLCESCDQLNVEDESPLLYSSIDDSMEVGKTSSCKFKLEEN